MPKSQPPGDVKVGEKTFIANVMPDVFDERDLPYRPRLQPLPPAVDQRPDQHFVLTQEGNSCTGHAVAAMINTVLAAGPNPIRVSPYMLYHFARRYDEFEGQDDVGSSLRGALKGWFYHGVLTSDDWDSLSDEVDIDLQPDLALKAQKHPLGAFYRVNAFRLDDMQSAVNELHAVAASALIHNGWIEPRPATGTDGRQYFEIHRSNDVHQLGGHAFSIVGYNDIGFLVQNSWGTSWGANGFATLRYEDWLTSAYDAWVARPGVPTSTNLRTTTKIVTTTSGGVAQGPGPDLERLMGHVVNLGNEGRLSGTGRFISTPAQIDLIFQNMKSAHEHWEAASSSGQPARRLVLYAHGGLVDEGAGLNVAQKQLNWWMNNGVYPVTFAWQSGPMETLISQLGDIVRDKLPFGGLGFDLVEQVDRLVEKIAGSRVSWMWKEMKENARKASDPLPADLSRPATENGASASMADMPGASLFARKMGNYAESIGGKLEVHLVGHSAGAIFMAHMLRRLLDEKIAVTSVSWLAPAIRVDEFKSSVLTVLEGENAPRFTCFGLSDSLELDDVVGTDHFKIYQKSLLYLVSRGLESGGETPLLGLQRHASDPGLDAALKLTNSQLIWSPREWPPNSRSSATSHGGMDEDTPTMTSVLLRILGLEEPAPGTIFRPYTSLAPHSPHLQGAAATEGSAVPSVEPVNVEDAGEVPVTQMGKSQGTEG